MGLHAQHRFASDEEAMALVSAQGDPQAFDPETLSFTPTIGEMNDWRGGHTAVLLEGGLVLLSGGGARRGEIYLPDEGVFERTTSALSIDRTYATATPIRDGGILILGGISFGDTIFLLASMDLFSRIQGPYGTYFQVIYTRPENRAGHTATRLEDESLLVAGGINVDWTLPELSTAFIFRQDD